MKLPYQVACTDILFDPTGGLQKAAGKATKNPNLAERGADRSVRPSLLFKFFAQMSIHRLGVTTNQKFQSRHLIFSRWTQILYLYSSKGIVCINKVLRIAYQLGEMACYDGPMAVPNHFARSPRSSDLRWVPHLDMTHSGIARSPLYLFSALVELRHPPALDHIS
jgi:hypothetical protein